MTRPEFETWLDNELRNVPVPPELRDKLRHTLSANDAVIDASLTNVDVPPQLIHRLREEVTGLVVDDRLRDVTIPRRLSGKLRRFIRRRAIAPLLSSAAAILILALGGYWLATHDTQDIAQRVEPAMSGESGESLVARDGLLSPAAGATRKPQDGGEPVNRGEVANSDGDGEQLAIAPGSDSPSVVGEASSVPGPRRPPSFDSQQSREALVDAGLLKERLSPERAVGAPVSRARGIPPLRMVPQLLARSGKISLSRGFDRQFLLKHGVHPRVVPAQDPQLAVNRVLLSGSVGSYERTLAELEAGRWPAAEDVHVEDFLAAVRYGLPAAPVGELAMFTNLGPSPFRAGHHVLQIAVKAGETSPNASGADQAYLLTVVVDLAPEMRYRLPEVQRALQHLTLRMRRRDRLSVVMSTAEPVLALDYATRDDAAAWVHQLEGQLSVDPQSDLVVATELANRATRKPVDISPENRRQIVISCSARQLADSESRELEKAFAELRQDGIDCLFADVGAVGRNAEGEHLGELDQLARRAGLTRLRRSLTEPLYPMVNDWLPHREQAVAHEVELAVKFDAKSVLSYRLVGYEPSPTGQSPEASPGTLRAHDVASAFYELQLSDTDDRRIATVAVKWTDAAHQPGSTLRRNLNRDRMPESELNSAPALRLAVLAAETAEVLRNSPFASTSPGEMQSLMDYAESVWPHVDTAGNGDLELLLQKAIRLSTAAR